MIDLTQIEKGMSTALLIRHSERNKIPDHVHDITEPLNENGEKMSVELGCELKNYCNKIRIISSPVGRCLQTGKAILKGFGQDPELEISTVLGEPGPFVVDRDIATQVFISMTCVKVVEAQISDVQLDGIRSKKDGSEYLLNYIVGEMSKSENSVITIFISHDACIIPFINFYTNEKFNKEQWLDFIDGVVIQMDNGKGVLKRNKIAYGI